MLSVGDVCGRVLKDDELGRHADMILFVAGEICGATAAVAVVAALFAGGQGISLKMDVQGSVGMLQRVLLPVLLCLHGVVVGAQLAHAPALFLQLVVATLESLLEVVALGGEAVDLVL